MHDESEVLTWSVREAARRAGVGEATIYEAVHAGRLKAAKIGRGFRIIKSDLLDWLAQESERFTR